MATGVVHLLVIAGLHIGILAAAVWWLVRRSRLSRGWSAALVSSAALVYMLLVDAGPSVVRATVLVVVMCAAWYFGRYPVSFNSLAAAALIVLVLNPSHLFHAGAQLSFLSVAGIIWFAPKWRPGAARPARAADRGQPSLAGAARLGLRPQPSAPGAGQRNNLAVDHAAGDGPFPPAYAAGHCAEHRALDSDGLRTAERGVALDRRARCCRRWPGCAAAVAT